MKYTNKDFEAMEQRIWEIELVLQQTYPQLLQEARAGKLKPMPPNPKDLPQQTQPGEQTPQAQPGDQQP